MSGTIIYRHTATSSQRHRCYLPSDESPGTIFLCECGRYWFVSTDTDGCAPPTYMWKPVRPWNFAERTRIREAQTRVGGRREGP